MTEPFLLKAESLSIHRQGRTLVDKASLSLQAGKVVSLIGPNGAGKTTLIRALMKLLKIDEGHLHIKEGLRIGYMPQKLNLDASLPITVLAFLSLNQKRDEHFFESAEKTDVRCIFERPMQSLSGGELQRVLLCRAILKKPQLLILDEPAQGLDVNGQAELYRLIAQLRDELNCGVLMVSHDLHFVMAATDEVICLNQHICCHGHPEKVSLHPEYLKLFGQQQAANVALYTHHHDHQHGVHGELIEPCNHNH
ncbi:zinc ABC transporter ATP-binding protein ZnuC [Pseudoteredinibacter isoporae]|uniref:Zinc transport system ATP-binding protein n=1 Tax=Pseudoteredinibacter isoporae TaxID=570281 RepID=A0A7X0JPW0_9GAMM|nr:zinc transport system ATP-binding protein [Pseudoteredinibacter isoporae]NHO85695.1 zinc ABC transporter ATP-binding protein ZnuC [Pseudoteredinibacter isoporae]NIB25853.1 zinc ABC transporter ATP-binding protein ZnuC [Pseudoteredinibacter isoporae]